MSSDPNNYRAYWPHYLPYPSAITRSDRMVPNRNAVTWPQAQFAPLYLPAGSPSFQPYSYLKNDVPLVEAQPVYRYGPGPALAPQSVTLPLWARAQGPGGDTAQLPYGDLALTNPHHIDGHHHLEGPDCGCDEHYDCGCGGHHGHAKQNSAGVGAALGGLIVMGVLAWGAIGMLTAVASTHSER